MKKLMTMTGFAGLLAVGVLLPPSATGEVVSFKDAASIKSWDAWNDHKGAAAWKEKPCVTRDKLLKMDPLLQKVGDLKTRLAGDIKSSRWSIGCETLDRDYADWNQYKRFLPELGCTRGRLFSGWAKTEQEKGVYDFSWLDPQVREMADMGIKPWICISYGNPVWGSDFRLGMRVRQITGNPEAFEAWLRYVKALVGRYADVVDEWEIWNEPFNQAEEYAELVYRTAKAVHEVQPSAKCFVTAITWSEDMSKNNYRVVLERLKKEDALDLIDKWIYHPYKARPEESYAKVAEPLRRLVKSYRPEYDIFQGEVGCPGQLEFAHALKNIEWTEYSQAKWNLRRAIGDAARDIPSNLFTFIDLQYTFMLQSFGLIRSNALKEPVYRRPSFFAMQNVYSFFDDSVRALGVETRTVNGKELTVAKFERQSNTVYAVWFSGERPGDSLSYERADLSFLQLPQDMAWMDFMNGRIYRLADQTSVPVWDSPVLIAPLRDMMSLARPTVCVGSYNIRTMHADKRTENAWELRKDDLVALLRRLDFDAFGLQEAFPAQSAYITNAMPEYALIGRIDGAEEKKGVTSPICYRKSRLEPVCSGAFWLSTTPDAPGGDAWDASPLTKLCVWALLKDRLTDSQFCFVNTHTDHIGKIARREGIKLIMQRMDSFVPLGVPVVFTGDHNCVETEEAAQEAAKHLKDALFLAETPPKGPWRTYNGRNWRDHEISAVDAMKMPIEKRNVFKKFGGLRGDYIYVSDGVRVLDYAIDASPRPGGVPLYPSDHFPLAATVEFPQPHNN